MLIFKSDITIHHNLSVTVCEEKVKINSQYRVVKIIKRFNLRFIIAAQVKPGTHCLDLG
jgi:hypothetical protein